MELFLKKPFFFFILIYPFLLLTLNWIIYFLIFKRWKKELLFIRIGSIFYLNYEKIVNKLLDKVEKELNEELIDELNNYLEKNKDELKEIIKEKIIFVLDNNLNKLKLSFLLKMGIDTLAIEIVEVLFNKYFNKKDEILKLIKDKKIGSLIRKRLEKEFIEKKDFYYSILEETFSKIFKLISIYCFAVSFIISLLILLILFVFF
jgi:hypothetical protein